MKKKEKQPLLTHAEAIDKFFGGVKELAKQPLPYTCSCGENNFTYRKKDLGMMVEYSAPIMSVVDCYKHIRNHKQRIKREVIQR